ncbi:discoidin domain-containing protein [Deinococcus peraridilitoris]|uniref:F5/8 type C domain-containing protein n=1 Tax=Deinococcus peraridilitoris (strain DSM 19664 / LMG 22246 / CIP 109416 / KR-200) TaxID=937777 RepID=L0A4N0_DEIPD|nr:discoidin domain-containing protein [Deinococcus peraridilitoris]AFZ68843.1 F5/8 type C domain-containing protein [Deinococcus peraridilitoris DSM 19664]
MSYSTTQSTLKLSLIGLTALLASCGSTTPPAPEVAQTAPLIALALPADAHPIKGSTASSATSDSNASRYSWDDQLSTWWSASSLGSWVRYDLGSEKTIDSISLAFYRGANRKATFDVELSKDGSNWTKVLSKVTSSGSTTNLERYNVSDQSARYIRVTNYGNTENSAIAITEAVVHGVGSTSSSGDTTTSTGRTYYVDCSNGSDSNSGTSTGSAWRSVGKVNNSWLNAGERLLLKRGCSWNGPLNLRWSGTSSARIIVDAYGSGDLPLIRNGNPGAVTISGSHKTIQNLRATADKPNSVDSGRCYGPIGWRIGFSFVSGSNNNTLQNAEAYGLTAGVHLEDGANNNKILRSRFTNNNVMSKNNDDGGDNDSGAWGVLVNGNDNEVAHNYFEGNTACSEDYGVEGASLELYYAKRNYFHHNTSINDTTFTELGGSSSNRSEYNRFEYNIYAPLNTNGRGEALVIRGWGSSWGANPGTVFNHNTVFNTNVGVFCGEGCGTDILTLRDNIIVTRSGATKDTVWTDGPINQSGNVFYQLDGQYKVTINGVKDSSRLGTSVWANPRLSDSWNRNFTLQSSAPMPTAGALPLR